MRLMTLTCLAALLAPFALAEDTEFFAVSSFGSMLIDRGEQLAAGVNETTLGVERAVGPGARPGSGGACWARRSMWRGC
jgi:hypothetical protein